MSSLRETAEEVLEKTVTEFDDEHGTSTPIPDLSIVEGRAHFGNREEYKLVLGEEGFRNPDGSIGPWNDENLSIFFENGLNNFYGNAAYIIAWENRRDLLETYSEATEFKDPELDISGGVRFRSQDNLGEFNKENHFIGLDHSLMREINPKTVEILGDTILPIITHENTHSLWYTTNPIYKPLIDKEVVGETDNYQNDIGRSPVEAITMYEQFKNYRKHFKQNESHFQFIEAIRNPRKLPDLPFNTGDDRYYLQNPYAFGTFGAFALEEALREKNEVENFEAATRRKLLHDSHPMYVEENIDLFFEVKSLPNYPEKYQRNFNWLQSFKGDRRNEAYSRRRDEIHGFYEDDVRDNLSYFLEIRALKDAFNSLHIHS